MMVALIQRCRKSTTTRWLEAEHAGACLRLGSRWQEQASRWLQWHSVSCRCME